MESSSLTTEKQAQKAQEAASQQEEATPQQDAAEATAASTQSESTDASTSQETAASAAPDTGEPPTQATSEAAASEASEASTADAGEASASEASEAKADDAGASEAIDAKAPVEAAPPPIAEGEDAQALMEASTEAVKRPTSYKVGEKIQGTLVKIGEKHAFVDIGQKSEATIAKEALTDAEGNLPEEGSQIEAYIIAFEDGNIELGKRLSSGDDSRAAIEEAHASGLPVEGKVTARNKGGLEVKVFGKRAFCPASHIELRFCENPEEYVGQTLSFRILELKDNGRQIVVSRRSLLEEEAKKHAETIRAKLEAGAEFDGTVTSLTDYGAFVDIGGGVEGLVHVSEISHQRVNDPKSVLNKGQSIRVQVLKYNPDQNRISLSMKALESDPWSNILETYPEGSTQKGKVVRLEKFGAFVELSPGIDGLIHISELSHKRVRHPSDVVQIGQEVEVRIIRNESDKRRIGLSMKDPNEAPVDSPSPKRSRQNNPRPSIPQQQSGPVFGTLGDLLKNVKIKD